ncbi:unnamed protein product, partial [Caenorhabditis bovis]
MISLVTGRDYPMAPTSVYVASNKHQMDGVTSLVEGFEDADYLLGCHLGNEEVVGSQKEFQMKYPKNETKVIHMCMTRYRPHYVEHGINYFSFYVNRDDHPGYPVQVDGEDFHPLWFGVFHKCGNFFLAALWSKKRVVFIRSAVLFLPVIDNLPILRYRSYLGINTSDLYELQSACEKIVNSSQKSNKISEEDQKKLTEQFDSFELTKFTYGRKIGKDGEYIYIAARDDDEFVPSASGGLNINKSADPSKSLPCVSWPIVTLDEDEDDDDDQPGPSSRAPRTLSNNGSNSGLNNRGGAKTTTTAAA